MNYKFKNLFFINSRKRKFFAKLFENLNIVKIYK